MAYPNRDSTPYRKRYNLLEADNIVRGTLRYQGFPEVRLGVILLSVMQLYFGVS